MNNQFVKKYLERIKYNGPINCKLSTLIKIQRSHLLNIPFENLDIIIGKNINLNINNLYHKIVLSKRGGLCYELNGLLFHLLKKIGFQVYYLSANIEGNDFDHILLLVVLDHEKWLVDVGFGNNFLEPIKFEIDKVQKDQNGDFKIVHDRDDYYHLLQFETLVYTFILKERKLADFQERCSYFETDIESNFRKNNLCSLERENGRVSLTDSRLKITKNENHVIKKIRNKVEFRKILNEVFHITIKES